MTIQKRKLSLFIGYRRSDSYDSSGRIYDKLVEEFGQEHVFKDVDLIPLGVDFREFILDSLKSTDIFLPIIGPNWAQTKNTTGNFRLFDSNDLVRNEIEIALNQEFTTTIPILVGKAQMPTREQLPHSIQQICTLNAAEIRPDPDFHKDCKKLINAIKTTVPMREKTSAKGQHSKKHQKQNKTLSRAIEDKIRIVGVGGAGKNMLNGLLEEYDPGVPCIVVGTDSDDLKHSLAHKRIILKEKEHYVFEASTPPSIKFDASLESLNEIRKHLQNVELVLLAAGLGGKTGTRAGSLIAKLAREMGITVISVVSLPFAFEGKKRLSIAHDGFQEISKHSNAHITIENQDLFKVANANTTFADAFSIADNYFVETAKSILNIAKSDALFQIELDELNMFISDYGRSTIVLSEKTEISDKIQFMELVWKHDVSKMSIPERQLGSKVIASVTASQELTMGDLSKIKDDIKKQMKQDGRLILSAILDYRSQNTFQISIWTNFE